MSPEDTVAQVLSLIDREIDRALANQGDELLDLTEDDRKGLELRSEDVVAVLSRLRFDVNLTAT